MSINHALVDRIADKPWFYDLNVRLIGPIESPFYYAQDIGDALGVKHVSSIINPEYTKDDIVTIEQREKYNIITYKRHKNGSISVDNTMLLLTECGPVD